jgi:hypothetical protein
MGSDDNLHDAVVRHAQVDMAANPSMWVDPPEPVQQVPSSEGVLYGEFRRGLKDLQNAVLDPWNGQVATHEEPGTIANPTQAQVTQDVGTVWGHDAYLDQVAAQHVAPPTQQIEIE